MSALSPHFFSRRRTVSPRVVILSLCAAIFIAASVFMYDSERAPIASSETRFVEKSESGLNVVPASCPSSPHYTGDCSGPGGSCPIGQHDLAGVGCVCDAMNVPPVGGQCPGGPTENPTGNPGGGSSCPNGLNISLYTSCVCPEGQVQAGNICVVTNPCPAGELWNGSQCVSTQCSGGQTWDGSQCVCPAGYSWNGVNCISVQMQCISQFFCSGSDRTGDGIGDDRWRRTEQCTESFSESCSWGCVNGQCLLAPSGAVDVRVVPALVRSKGTTVVSWSATNVSACIIDENNPDINDSWSGGTMGCAGGTCSGSIGSSAITQQTRYTLRCTGLNGSSYTDSATVNILPVFIEL